VARQTDPFARSRRGRDLARALLGLAVIAIVVVGLVAVAAPGFPDGMSSREPPPIGAIGFSLAILGLGWMLRINRRSTDPEPEGDNWRYRDF
jgi:hypothetical protein